MRTVLVVDDEARIVQLARDYLEHAGFAVLTASDGPSALEAARRHHPDLVVLDIGLPGLDGLDVTRALRRDSAIPIVMLTARDDELDKLLGLELGADDYLTKPFSPRELVARVKAVLRRTEGAAAPGDVIRAGEVVLDVPRMRAEVAGRTVDLTATEFGLLATMAASPGRIFTRSQLLDAVRGVAFESYERAIDSHIKNLRRKVEPDPREPRYVLTVYGVGYRFADDRELGPDGRDPGSPVSAGPGGGPPAGPPNRRWRADHGPSRPWNDPDWDRTDPLARQMRLRARIARRRDRRNGAPWHRRQGFGCIFAVLFLIVVGSLVTAIASVLSHLGPLPVVIVAVMGVVIVAALLRGTIGAARDLDRMLAATRRVEDGDYGVRVGKTHSDLPPIQELARGFDTMAARLQADEEQRRTLLADVSHELRTPLAIITGNLEAIVDGVYPPDPAHLAPILDETRVLERLIDDLRTISLSEAGMLPLHPEPTDPDLLIADVARSFRPSAEAASVAVIVDAADELPILEVDPVRIREVLSNLVANALRHTPAGGRVTIGGSVERESLVLTVTDTGPGIDPELLPHVFDRFVKGVDSRGSGLGLAIARGLVEAHGGSISVTSPAGAGTTFRVSLPLVTGG